MGLRGRTAALVAGAVVLVATVIGLLVHRQTAGDQLADARRVVDSRLLTAVRDHADGESGAALTDPPGLPDELRRLVTRDRVRATYLQEGDGERDPVLWAATRTDGQVLAVRHSYAPQARALADLDGVLIGSGALAAVLGCGLGVAVAAAMGRRIGASARTAQRIADGDLSARVSPRGRDEIARLGAAVNTMADALAARLEAERRVTADIAHELRTPVAGLVTAAGLLPPDRSSELVQDRVHALRSLVEDVLEVARLDVPGVEQVQWERATVSSLARRAVAAVVDGDPAAGDRVRLLVGADADVDTDPRRVERILGNLVTNALRHGAPPVEVEVDGPVVRVTDRGTGFPGELLAQGPQRFRTGARERGRGTGLGLTIVAGQAHVLGVAVTFANPPEGGARATVDLSARQPARDWDSPGAAGAGAGGR
ncbi:ATP-binding protein [Streptomyces sp. NPDC001922]|uniref:ATP-binding protein n=1 Tax=Streptomyces sp. NPDC001922 TaxID=3364624 RepID=UPI00368C67F2